MGETFLHVYNSQELEFGGILTYSLPTPLHLVVVTVLPFRSDFEHWSVARSYCLYRTVTKDLTRDELYLKALGFVGLGCAGKGGTWVGFDH
jgi:hypothetical protein